MIGTKFEKPIENWSDYSKAAEWCNEHQAAYIEDKGDFYEVVPLPEPTFEELKERRLTELSSAFDTQVSGSTEITVGDTAYTMQFNRSDSLAVQGLIELMEATGQTTGYLTQADDTTVYDVPLDDIKAALIGMLKAYAECHAKKQEYRSQINACTTKEELDAIEFVF